MGDWNQLDVTTETVGLREFFLSLSCLSVTLLQSLPSVAL
jgi:hypothetical protein